MCTYTGLPPLSFFVYLASSPGGQVVQDTAMMLHNLFLFLSLFLASTTTMAEAAPKAEADPYLLYGGYGLGYGHFGYGYGLGYRGYYWG